MKVKAKGMRPVGGEDGESDGEMRTRSWLECKAWAARCVNFKSMRMRLGKRSWQRATNRTLGLYRAVSSLDDEMFDLLVHPGPRWNLSKISESDNNIDSKKSLCRTNDLLQ